VFNDHTQAQQLHHSFGYDIVILAHKPNPMRGFVPHFSTVGAASTYFANYPVVGSLWEQHMVNYYAGMDNMCNQIKSQQ